MTPAAFSVPALEQLLAEINAMAPDRSTASDGWIGDQAHAARVSDHNPEPDGSVDARDFTHDPAHGVDCNLLADQIKDDRRVSYIIWDHQIWNPAISRSWRPYTGSNPHDKHMHVSVTDAGQNDTSRWLEEEDDVTKEDLDAIREMIQNNADKVADAAQADIRAEGARTRRAIWRSFGKTKAEIDDLEAKVDDEDAGPEVHDWPKGDT